MKDILDILNSPLMKTKGVIRYSGLIQAEEESLSDHILDVMNMSYLISRNLELLGTRIDLGLLLGRALVHDCDEVLIGDIPRLTKYSSVELHEKLDDLAEITAKKMSQEIDNTDYTYLLWSLSKNNDIEGTIIQIADMASVAHKVMNEIIYNSNLRFLRVAYELKSYSENIAATYDSSLFNEESNVYIVVLLNSISDLMTKLGEEYSSNLEVLNISSLNSIQKEYIDHDITKR